MPVRIVTPNTYILARFRLYRPCGSHTLYGDTIATISLGVRAAVASHARRRPGARPKAVEPSPAKLRPTRGSGGTAARACGAGLTVGAPTTQRSEVSEALDRHRRETSRVLSHVLPIRAPVRASTKSLAVVE